MKEECGTACRIFTQPKHQSLGEAIAADLVVFLPLAGNASALIRSKNLGPDGNDLQYLTYVIDSIPILSDLTDILVPVNLLTYLIEKGRLPKLPLPE